MISIQKKIETIMTGENNHGHVFLGSFLALVSKAYGGAVKLRQKLYRQGVFKSRRLPCTVISVGNLSVGGTGKTPMTIYLADLIKGLGYKVVVISRGYKGHSEKAGGIVSDGSTLLMDSKTAGDEHFAPVYYIIVVFSNSFCPDTCHVRTGVRFRNTEGCNPLSPEYRGDKP